MNALQRTSLWLAANAGFPARRLPPQAELLLCVAAAAAENEATSATGAKLFERRVGAETSALRAHEQRRSRVHYKCDNSAKV